MNHDNTHIFNRMLKGGILKNDDPQMPEVWEAVANTIKLSSALNTSLTIDETRERLSQITGKHIDKSTTIFIPFYTNFGKHIVIGKNVFINHACSFLDLGGITIEDNVLIGMGAIVMDDAVIGTGSVIAAGAIVLPKTVVEPGSIYAGMPAKKVKNVGPDMIEVIERTAHNYPMYAEWYK